MHRNKAEKETEQGGDEDRARQRDRRQQKVDERVQEAKGGGDEGLGRLEEWNDLELLRVLHTPNVEEDTNFEAAPEARKVLRRPEHKHRLRVLQVDADSVDSLSVERSLSGNRWQSVAIGDESLSAERAFSGNQWQSVAIRCTQRPSVAISGHQWPSAHLLTKRVIVLADAELIKKATSRPREPSTLEASMHVLPPEEREHKTDEPEHLRPRRRAVRDQLVYVRRDGRRPYLDLPGQVQHGQHAGSHEQEG
jgi:hypothetical protein